MSVDEALEKITHNIKAETQNIDQRIEERLDDPDPDEDVKMLAGQTRQLAQQVESLCTVIQKLKEYE